MQAFRMDSAAVEPISVPEAKEWLRIDGAEQDELVAGLVPVARETIEQAARRILTPQTWRLVLDAWPAQGDFGLALPLAPLSAVLTVRVFQTSDQSVVLAPDFYTLQGPPDARRLVFSDRPPAPGRAAAGIEIDCAAGYAAPSSVPSPLRQAMLQIIAHLFENRGDAGAAAPMSPTIERLIAPYRRPRLL